MCWNATISLNTFLFSTATLAFVAYNNAYTKYKLTEFVDNPWLYLAFMSFILIQLVEYFLWRSIESRDANMNNIMSIIGSLIIASQPLAVSMLITNKTLQPIVTSICAVVFAFHCFLKYPGQLDKFTTVISPSTGSLQWKWNTQNRSLMDIVLIMGYFATFFIAAFYVPTYLGIIAAVTLVLSWWIYGVFERMIWGSKWCWSANLIMIYLLVRIMVILPFGDMSKLCR
jgi:hypothetical protein